MRVRQLVLALMLQTTMAQGQIRLPPLPGLPLQNLPQSLDQAEPGTRDLLSDARHLEIRRLIRANRRTVDTDSNGEPVVRGEILALSMDDDALMQAQSRGFVIDRQQSIVSANIHLIVLKAPAGWSTKKALLELREAIPSGLYDYNHIYGGSGVTGVRPTAEPPIRAPSMGMTDPQSEAPRPRTRVGLLDAGVDDTHPVFHDSIVHGWGCGGRQVPSPHGTAVASLLIAHASAELYAADVYCGVATGGAVDAIVAALAWMDQELVPVINVSLVGPKNLLLERIVNVLIARGHLLVAAVGNDGPAAPPLYPAAYVGVVGVTAVDAKQHVLPEAERGPQVMFSALGADLKAANIERGYDTVRGTSFAAPTVAALLADALPSPSQDAARAAIEALAKQAIDLGPPGKDLTYGFGLVGADLK
jgi:hypothetical protein